MSYNLYAEGDLDLFALSHLARRFERIEVFPIAGDGKRDALGVALPSSRADEAAIAELRELLVTLHATEARVFDLFTGEQIATAADVAALRQRILGA